MTVTNRIAEADPGAARTFINGTGLDRFIVSVPADPTTGAAVCYFHGAGGAVDDPSTYTLRDAVLAAGHIWIEAAGTYPSLNPGVGRLDNGTTQPYRDIYDTAIAWARDRFTVTDLHCIAVSFGTVAATWIACRSQHADISRSVQTIAGVTDLDAFYASNSTWADYLDEGFSDFATQKADHDPIDIAAGDLQNVDVWRMAGGTTDVTVPIVDQLTPFYANLTAAAPRFLRRREHTADHLGVFIIEAITGPEVAVGVCSTAATAPPRPPMFAQYTTATALPFFNDDTDPAGPAPVFGDIGLTDDFGFTYRWNGYVWSHIGGVLVAASAAVRAFFDIVGGTAPGTYIGGLICIQTDTGDRYEWDEAAGIFELIT